MSNSKPWPKRQQNHWNLDPYATWSTDEKSDQRERPICRDSSHFVSARRLMQLEPSSPEPISKLRVARRHRLRNIVKRTAIIRNLANVLQDEVIDLTLSPLSPASPKVPRRKRSRQSSPDNTSAIGTRSMPILLTSSESDSGSLTYESCGEEQERAKRAKFSTPTSEAQSMSTQAIAGLMGMKDKK